MFDIKKPEPPYIILEALTPNRHGAQGVHAISLASKPKIFLGRGHESDIRVPDISVSRTHASIEYDDGMFILNDNNSKFGTLRQVSAPLVLDESVMI